VEPGIRIEGLQKKELEWLFNIERKAILPIKWLLFLLCTGLAVLKSPAGIVPKGLFFCLLAFFVSNAFLSYLIYLNRVALAAIRAISYVSYAADVLIITVYVYLAGSRLGGSGEFYILFFLVILRGSGFFPNTRLNLVVNVAVSLIFITTLIATYHGTFLRLDEFISKTVLLTAVMLLSWFLMDAISTQKRRLFETNEALLREYDYNQRLLESMADGVIAVNRDLEITAMNDAARQILGLESPPRGPSGDPAYPVGGDVLLLPREIAESFRLTLEESMRLTNHVMEVTTRESESVTLRFSTRTIRGGGGELVGVVAVFEDISVLRRLEDQMIRSEKLASVGELAAGIAHELGNPISIIKSCVSYMKSKWESLKSGSEQAREDADVSDEIEVILSESDRCEGLVKQLLSFSSRSRPEVKEVSLCEAAERAVSLVRYQKDADGIEFAVECLPGSETVIADESLLDQALINVLLNAVQSMDGKGRVTVHARPVEEDVPLLEGKKRKWVDVAITDQGSGIPKNHLDSIFDPFYTTKEKGTGLGLSITHGVVERMGGSIRVESELRRGSTFTIRLPAEKLG
jgi:signal transduction histidine kinase